MDLFNSIINALLRGFYAAFSWAGPSAPAVSLTVLSVLVGLGMLWVFRKTSDQARIRAIKRKVYAYLLEMRVYGDDPGATWRAQKSLMSANLRYMGLALKPAFWMAVPLAILLIHLEAFYGRAPLEPGRPVVVTASLRNGAEGPAPELQAPPGVTVSAPPVRVVDENQVSWRIVPQTTASSELRFRINGQSIDKEIVAGGSQRFVPGRRVQSAWEAFWHPDEARIASPDLEWVDIAYPAASIPLLGFHINWLVWFLVVSMLAALLLKKRFGVTL
jgi:uncharacterized membrane protein (DUF106 family)